MSRLYDSDLHSQSLEDEEAGVLYDILVFKEWLDSNSEVEKQETIDKQKLHRIPIFQKEKTSWSQYLKFAHAKTSSTRFKQLEELKLPWTFAVTPDCSRVAVSQDDVIEILSYNSKSYVPTSRIKLEEEETFPRFRTLAWSPKSEFLVFASGTGRVYIFTEDGDLVYSLMSPNLPPVESNSGVDHQKTICKILFSEPRQSGDWVTELTLIERSGMITSFLLSQSGYQEILAFPLFSKYPNGICDVAFVEQSQLLYVSGPDSSSTHGMTCWRKVMTDDNRMSFEEVNLKDPGQETSSWRSWLGWKSGSSNDDFAYLLAIAPTQDRIAAVHFSGAITVWSIPGLRPIASIPLDNQSCFDDVNPQFLQKQSAYWRHWYAKHPFKWHPLGIRWWSDKALVVARVSGGLSILNLDEEDGNVNLIGDSAEFFAPSFALSQRFESGFFILECENQEKKVEILEDSDEAEAGLRDQVKAKVMELLGYGQDEDHVPDLCLERTFRILYFQSTSPEELYAKKIQNEEYGEAIILARHYSLDCDQVYERQWRLSKHSRIEIDDYLSKMTSIHRKLKECLCTIPNSVEANEELLKFGLKCLRQRDRTESEDETLFEAYERQLNHFLECLELYSTTLKSEDDFNPVKFNEFRSRAVMESVEAFAHDGEVDAVERLMCEERAGLGQDKSRILTRIPESIDPMKYSNLLSQIRDADWFNKRCYEIMESSGQADLALRVMNIALNMDVKVDSKFYHLVSTFETLTTDLQLLDLTFDKVNKASDQQLLEMLMSKSTVDTISANFSRIGLSFLDRVEQYQAGASKDLTKKFVAKLSTTSFSMAASLLRTLLEHVEESWMERKDVLEIGLDAVVQANGETDPELMIKFTSFLIQEFGQSPDLEHLMDLLKGLQVLRKRKVFYSVKELKSALDSEKAAQDLITSILTGRLKKSLGESEIEDMLMLQKSCGSSIGTSDCFRMFGQALLESNHQGSIQLAQNILTGSFSASSSAEKIGQVLVHFEVSLPSQQQVEEMCIKACRLYIDTANDLRDDKIKSASACILSNSKAMQNLDNFVKAIQILDRNLSLSRGCKPAHLFNLSSIEEFTDFVGTSVQLFPFTTSLQSDVLNFAYLLSKSKGFFGKSERVVKRTVISVLAQALFDNQDFEPCSSLCQELLQPPLDEIGWQVCFKLAVQGQGISAQIRTQLISFALTYCDPKSIVSVSRQREQELVGAKLDNQDWIPVIGYEFFENSLLYGRIERDEPKDECDIFGVTKPRPVLDAQLSDDQLESIFLQDPLLASAYLHLCPRESSLDTIRLMTIIDKALSKMWLTMGQDTLQATVNQMVNVIHQAKPDFIRSIVPTTEAVSWAEAVEDEAIELVTNIEVAKPLGDQGQGDDGQDCTSKPEGANEDEEAEEEEAAEPVPEHEICQSYASQIARGVPRGLRTLFSNLGQ